MSVGVVVNGDWDTEGISAVVVDGDMEGLAAVMVVVVALHPAPRSREYNINPHRFGQ